MEFLQSETALAVFVLLAVYFAIKFVAAAGGFWIPQNRKKTLTEAQLRAWRLVSAMGSLGMAALWAGLIVGTRVHPNGYFIALAGLVVFVIFKIVMMKKFPYIDPSTVRNPNKKKKKK